MTKRLAYPIDEAATEVLGISRSRAYEAARKGELRTYKEGRCRMVTHRACEDYIARREAEALPAVDSRRHAAQVPA